jgi:hypothetical protein
LVWRPITRDDLAALVDLASTCLCNQRLGAYSARNLYQAHDFDLKTDSSYVSATAKQAP